MLTSSIVTQWVGRTKEYVTKVCMIRIFKFEFFESRALPRCGGTYSSYAKPSLALARRWIEAWVRISESKK